MKLKTNKLLTLTLASSLVAITAGCGGGTKAAAPKGDTDDKTPTVVDTVTYSDWSAVTTIADDDTDNAFLAGVAATGSGATATAVTLTGLTAGEDATTLNLAYEVTEAVTITDQERTAITLAGAATNGVAFATNGDDTDADLRYVAGVVAGADLGAPLTTTTAGGVWNGIFQAVGANAVEKDFILTVNFTDSEISGIVPVGADTFATDATSYYISGSYDAAGVITGNILYGDFSDTATDDATASGVAVTALEAAIAADAEDTDTVGLATLSGLIGENGALGAFYSSGSDGTGATGFAGGFVALTAENVGGDDPDVVYADWADGVTQVAVITDNAFLAGTAKGLTGAPSSGATVETLDLAEVITPAGTGTAGTALVPTAVQGTTGSRLGGADTNGVAFFTTGATTEARYFAGLHNTTDLGAPISAAPTTAIWNGLFQAVGAGDYATAAKAFALTVTYSATADSTIIGLVGANTNADAFTAAGTSYYISGTYNADGVITGSVLYRDFSAAADDAVARTAAAGLLTTATADGAASPATDGLGVLSGLIGANGAVGAFYSNAEDATDGYAGGFVVSTTANADIAPVAVDDFTPPEVVEYADWTGTRATALTANGFLAGTTGDALTLAPASGTTIEKLDRAGSAAGGVSFFTTGATGSEFYHAGLHFDTNLGAPVSTTDGTATWPGTFQAVGAASAATITAAKPIMLAISFGTTRTITGSVAAGLVGATTVLANPAYHINATYTAAGLISGNILYQATSVAAGDGVTAAATFAETAGFGTVTGLIGADGLVGAFHSSNTADGATGPLGYSGGFIAAPGS